MSGLPPTWAQVQLSSITGEASQRVPLADETIRYIDIGSVNRNTKSIESPQELLGKDAPSRARKQVAVGDTLVSMTRPNLNAVALVPKELDGQIASTGFDVLRPVAGIDPRWIGYLVRTEAFVEAMSDLVQGALYPAVRSKDVRAYIAPLAPQAEQTRIANQLDTLLARVQACNDRFDAIPALLKRFRQSVLSMAGSGELLVTPSKAALPLVALGAVLAEPLRNGKSVRDGEGLPVLRLTALKSGEIDLAETKAGDWSNVPDVRRFLIQGGDYLVSRGNGSKDLVGRGGLVGSCSEDIAFPDTMIRIRPDNSRLLPSYLKYAWASPFVREQIERAAKTTAGIWKLSQPDLENVRFPLPTLENQAEIVGRVEALFALADRTEARCTAARAQTQRLIPLVLAKAFRGELVSQDENDIPANQFLTKLGTKVLSTAKSRQVIRSSKPRIPNTMKNSDKESIKLEILALEPGIYLFEELRMKVSGDYELIKTALFELLQGSNSSIQQVFDEEAGSLKLVSVKP